MRTENTSSRWWAEVGERRVVFARAGEVHSLCSPIDDAKNAERTMREIRTVARSPSSIEGTVIDANSAAVSGRGFEVVDSMGKRRAVRTDRHGRFRIAVPPGRYSLDLKGLQSDWPEARGDVDQFTVSRGECAQFQLRDGW